MLMLFFSFSFSSTMAVCGLGQSRGQIQRNKAQCIYAKFCIINHKDEDSLIWILNEILCWIKAGWFWNDWCICRVTRDSNGYSSLQSYLWKRHVNLLNLHYLYFFTCACTHSYMFQILNVRYRFVDVKFVGFCYCISGFVGDIPVFLAKPQTYMNLIGESVSYWETPWTRISVLHC